jgi:hypothetical protein
MTAPIQPVTLHVAELTAIKSALIEKSHALRRHADSGRGATGPERAAMRGQAARYEDIAARLSFAQPGEPIQVVDQC